MLLTGFNAVFKVTSPSFLVLKEISAPSSFSFWEPAEPSLIDLLENKWSTEIIQQVQLPHSAAGIFARVCFSPCAC